MTNKIIILNGSSSAGKSTLAKELKNSLPDCYHLGIDDFLPSAPEAFFSVSDIPDSEKVGLHHKLSENQKAILDYTILPKGYFFQECVYAAVAAFCTPPISVIFDTLIINEQMLQIAAQQLAAHTVFFVGVYCSEEERKRRELERGDRLEGLYRLKADFIYEKCKYDLEVDTTNQTPAEVAKEITKMLDVIKPEVFKNILKQSKIY